MGNTFKLITIKKHNSRLDFDYEIKGDWQKYFELSNKLFIEYGCNVESVPDSVAVIPLICNILPVVWLCDAELIIEELDRDFYTNLGGIKKGYEDMYPMLDFSGKLTVSNVVDNQKPDTVSYSSMLFSGGVDAYTTLLRHIKEKPYLISLWGADVKLSDTKGWEKVNSHIQSVAEKYRLPYIYVKTNFREVLNDGTLGLLVKKSGDGWWHGFQHGIALISHVAPIAHESGVKTTYIASSFPRRMKGRYTCASDPTIDNYVCFCGCRTVHDGYELDRQEKVRYLVSQKQRGNPIKLRVCWEAPGGGNCCACEKCYRTALEIISEGENPNDFGFAWGEKNVEQCRKDIKYKIRMSQFNWDQYYPSIQRMMKSNAENIPDIESYGWLQEIDFSRVNNSLMKALRYSILVRGIRKLIRLTREIRK